MKLIILVFYLLVQVGINAQNLMDLKKNVQQKIQQQAGSFSEDEAAAALRQALSQGATLGAEAVHKTDGYFKNLKIKIPLPADAQQAETKMRNIGLGANVDEALLNINRAAEQAGAAAKDVFIQAIQGMTVKDAISIIKGASDAGTQFLKQNASNGLYTQFKPIIEDALQQVGATKHYAALATQYNRIPGGTKINPDLADYTTQKAIAGLFILIAEEELKIRNNPAARSTELLKKVFQ